MKSTWHISTVASFLALTGTMAIAVQTPEEKTSKINSPPSRRAIIPATRGRPTTKPLRGHWRNKMKRRFPKRKYGQRWQIATVNSMIQRTLGAALRARQYWSQSREIVLKVLTLNVTILWRS